MLKVTVFLSLLVIASVAFATSLSCQSCGTECITACGTRRFRTCCFNYLRRKRGPDAVKYPARLQGSKSEGDFKQRTPDFFLEDPEIWSVPTNEYQPSYLEDLIENALPTSDV